MFKYLWNLMFNSCRHEYKHIEAWEDKSIRV